MARGRRLTRAVDSPAPSGCTSGTADSGPLRPSSCRRFARPFGALRNAPTGAPRDAGHRFSGILTCVAGDDITIRPLRTREDCEAGVRLQRDIWGRDFVDVVPATILQVSQRVGGVASGAFAPDGRLVGFVFGISGVRDGAPAHWSDMLAVRPEARGRGLGRRLKLHQREQLLAVGVERVYWSFDPLVSRNARLNLVALGAEPVEYVPDMYGDTASVLHRGLDTDRLVVEWRLRDPAVERILDGGRPEVPAEARAAPIVTAPPPGTEPPPPPRAPWVRVELPADVEHLKAADPEAARRWQRHLRRAFTTFFDDPRARVAGLHHDATAGRWFYLVRTEEPS